MKCRLCKRDDFTEERDLGYHFRTDHFGAWVKLQKQLKRLDEKVRAVEREVEE